MSTDGEGYGPLLGFEGGAWRMGYGNAPILFCPWCGAGKEIPVQPTSDV